MTNDRLAATFHGASLTDTLRPILAAYRAEVQPHWSPATAHPDFDGKAGDPAGQCGVTSAWLQRRLAEDHGIAAWYCVGRVMCATHGQTLRNHCWLEIGDMTWDRTVIDLTADQIPCWDGTFLYASYWVIYEEFARYSADVRLPEPEWGDDLRPRLAILTAEVGR